MQKALLKVTLFLLMGSLVSPSHAKHHGLNPIFDAAGIDGNLTKVKKIISRGISVNTTDHIYGATPLIFATYWGSRTVVKELIKRKANVNAQDNDGWTALMYAAKWRKEDIVIDLLKAGANPNLVANDGSTALMDAAYILWGSEKAMKALIKAGANVNAQENSGWTALMYASRYNKKETITDLLKAGANPNLIARDGTTALIEAANRGHAKACKLLLAAGADTTAKNRSGKTALQLAIAQSTRTTDTSDKKHYQETCHILRRHNAAQRTAKKTMYSSKTNQPQKPVTPNQPISRWARFKAKVLNFFKRS